MPSAGSGADRPSSGASSDIDRHNPDVFGFVHRPPVVVGDLAAALGMTTRDLASDGRYRRGSVAPVTGLPSTVDRVWADYAYDPYHGPLVRSVDDLARQRLTGFTVRFSTGRRACEAELLAAHGIPVPVIGHRRHGPFVVDGLVDDPFTLHWFATPPDWACPPVDAAARYRAVAHVAARVRAAGSHDDLDAALADIPPGVGVTLSMRSLLFRPAIAAVDLAHALGFPHAVADNVGLHQVWAVVDMVGRRTAPLRLGRWEVTAMLTTVPQGVRSPRPTRLGVADVVRCATFTVPRRG
jgi:hypothetical protein